MANICIVYAREDELIAERLYGLLSPLYDVWWDDKITGRFATAIEAEIPKAGCIVALLSTSSRKKDTFTEELRLAQKHNVELVLLRLDKSDPPYPFGSYSYTELEGWNGEVDHRGIRQLLRRVAILIPPKAKPMRPSSLFNGVIKLPSLFFSVSSHETQLIPAEAIKALRVFGASTILVSAYDLVARRSPQAVIDEITKYREQGGFVLIDSGNYEASRLGSRRWKHADLSEALDNTPHDWAFCFDVMNPRRKFTNAVNEILEAVRRDSEYTSASILPIVHAPKIPNAGYCLDGLPAVIREIANRLEPELIAVPERELGPGLIARAKTIRAIREELNQLPFYQPLHILGTGNPWSMAVLASAGADSFDGLEWCRFAVDPDSEKLHHFQHFDFFAHQTPRSPVVQAALEDSQIGFGGKVAFHNLDYFSSYMRIMRQMFAEHAAEAFVTGLIGKKITVQIKEQIPGLFK